jgi:hypothetical protein
MSQGQSFEAWLSSFAESKKYIIFKLLNGDTMSLFQDLHFGGDFVAGNLSEDPNDGRGAIRYEAITSLRGGDNIDSTFNRPLRYPPSHSV